VDNDICEIKAQIVDRDDKIIAKVLGIYFSYLVNDSKKENEISSDFFLPFSGNSRIMVGGSGTQCNVKNLICKTIHIRSQEEALNNSAFINSEKRGCDCCIIV
jgi:hypothetical protein